ncbi:MAG: RNA methyltransferase [Ignavibacteriales bacterium]|nr:RNA methyltransferase [Ignavibacteriales bacterium]
MKAFKTEQRINKITSTVRARQFSLRVVLENIHDPHNVSAILRTCDAVGVPKVSLLYTVEKFPKLSRITSASANKWVEKEKFKSVDECYGSLRKDGFRIFASSLNGDSKDFYDLDFTKKTAIVIGNEHRGVTKDAVEQADEIFRIPMFGMVQSLNVSVATAVILYEILRQRRKKGFYTKNQMDETELEKLIEEWCKK